jgi:hypothetical protein
MRRIRILKSTIDAELADGCLELAIPEYPADDNSNHNSGSDACHHYYYRSDHFFPSSFSLLGAGYLRPVVRIHPRTIMTSP